ncbi:branched-chain amino acid aminotransferase 2, chloroplastic isoform X2 [Helianthus annuus]|uniref:branched-chain amino acid aminotransferase 2, chloroplastic isoform X2 n=1 Tax=Helianthus annuus TaxID=4232 RepID=UPI000B8FEFFA|nr:branched-chain amino acid aminotransferase 2, chloroplastic isoform X2 [Helianthus annuus]
MIRQSPFLGRFAQISLSKVRGRCLTTHVASTLQETKHMIRDEEYADIDWNNLGYGIIKTDYIYKAKCTPNNTFEQGQVSDYENIELSPAAGVLNYGQIPPPGKGSLYIRPLLIGSGPTLGVSPAPEYTFLVYASPVGNYFKEGTKPLNLYVNTESHRATSGGTGGVKSITNYAPVLKAISRAKEQGFSDVVYLDSVHKKYIEEASCSNIFLVKGNVISTPATIGTILEGITRKSIIDIARDLGYKVEERLVAVDELMEADEIFTTGTAVSVATVGSVTYNDRRVEYKTGDELVSQKLYKTLVGIQVGKTEDKFNWVVEIK